MLLRIRRRALRRRSETIRHCRVVVIVVELGPFGLSRRPLPGLRQGLGRLRGGDQTEIVLGVLEVIFGGDRIAASMSIARQLEIFLGDMLRVSANLHVRAVRFV